MSSFITDAHAVQGSDSLDSWRANLSFDPVTFEDASLGVSVHRGMYEAALALYPRFAPMVAEHLASSPFARISFTGHSLGGSISTILAIMMVHRKLVRPSQLSPLYTFGAAACFCEADHVEQIACGRPVSGDVTDAVRFIRFVKVCPALHSLMHSSVSIVVEGAC